MWILVTSPRTVSFYGLERNIFKLAKGRPREEALPVKVERAYKEDIASFVLRSHDPENCITLDHFKLVQTGTECVFAKQAKLWGGREYNSTLTLEDNILKWVPPVVHACVDVLAMICMCRCNTVKSVFQQGKFYQSQFLLYIYV